MTPSDHRGNPSPPSSSLQLEWVHGCRGFDCRNNVRYLPSKDGERSFVFTAASLGVIQSIDRRVQNHFGEHTDDLVSISVFSSSSSYTVATGEMGKNPVIHLWDEKLVSLACLRGTHTKAVVQLAHSQDGNYLFSVGLEYTVALYCIDQTSKRFGKQVSSSQGPKSKILHASAYGTGSSNFVTCGEKHICFWTNAASGLSYESVNLSRGDKNKIFLSVCPLGDNGVVIGASDGTLLYFVAGKLIHSTSLQQLHPNTKSASSQMINALWSPPESPSTFFVGGKGGFLGRYEFAAKEKNFRGQSWQVADEPTIRSISTQLDKLLICTLACEIIELDLLAPQALGNVLNVGHFKNELWGLAIRPPSQEPTIPFSREFASVGDDHYLRVFSITERQQIFALDMKSMARCCDYSPDGSMLAVGYGGRVGKGKPTNDGMFRVYRMNYFEATEANQTPGKLSHVVQIFEARDAKQTITDIKFSADNRLLVVGSKDNSIYIYSVAQRFKFRFKFSRHKSSITHLDLSRDGKYMQSTCGAYELLFCNLSDGKPVLRGSTLMNTEWSTWTCPLGWPVQGIWPPCADGTDINAVDRSPGGSLLATADDFGKVKVFRYPVVTPKSESNLYSGHSSHVTNVRWATGLIPSEGGALEAEDTYLISTGGNDKCIFQWRNVLHDEDLTRPSTRSLTSNGHQEREDASVELEAPSGGDEFMAIKPWKGAIKAPSNFGAAPDPTRVVQFQAALGNSLSFAAPHILCSLGNYASQHARLYADSVSIPPDRQIYLDVMNSPPAFPSDCPP
jgi:echinoderm microtubule-associated protein-like 6